MQHESKLIEFLPTQLVEKNGKQYFLWKLTDEVKKEIAELLNVESINYSWSGSCESVPQFKCHECGQHITFADMIRGALKVMPGKHSSDMFVKVFESKDNYGDGREHILYCRNGHKQIPVTGWAINFNYSHQIV